MKKIFLFLYLCFTFINYGICQLKVDNLGHIGLGTNYPNYDIRAHIKGDLLITNYPNTPWYEFQFKVGIKNGAVIGSTGGFIDFYTANSGYNKLIARNFITHSQWGKTHSEIINGLEIIQGLNPVYRSHEEKTDFEKGEFVITPEGLLNLVPCTIQEDEDGYGIDYIQIIPLLVSAIQEQQSTINNLADEIKNLKNNAQTTTIPELKIVDNSNNILIQNNPNPINTVTTIGYHLQNRPQKASIIIYDLNGLQLEEYPLSGDCKGSISIDANKFQPGIYLYSLFVDNKLVDTKKMIITSY